MGMPALLVPVVKPITKCSKTRIKLSLTAIAFQTIEIGSNALSGNGIDHKAI